MRAARLVLAFAPFSVLGFAALAPAQLASAVHVVTLVNRVCPPTYSCSALLRSAWYSGHPEVFRLVTSNLNAGGVLEGVYFAHPISYYYFDEALDLTRLTGDFSACSAVTP
jgi:hypothetical protein